ncbi:MAG: DUF1801 domain-containing protein [Sphingomonas sp.]|nr:DUF1801 domain-containing protein [Sphingomonas sp.]
METLFIFPEAGTRHAHVDEWLAKHDNEIGKIARILVDRVRSCGDDIRELVHDGRPTLCVEMAAFAYVDAYSRHAAIGFFEGASLPDPEKLLQGQGKRMRHIKLRTLDEVALPSLLMMIDAAYHDMRRRLGLD